MNNRFVILRNTLLMSMIVGSVCFNTACVSQKKVNTAVIPNDLAIISDDIGAREAELKLADSAVAVSDSLHQLAEIEKAKNPQARLPSPPSADLIGMNQLASLEWNGPIAPLVDKIAKATNYKARILGKQPAVPILISISAKDTPMADILRDATFQCGNKANIVVYPASKTIELRYAPK